MRVALLFAALVLTAPAEASASVPRVKRLHFVIHAKVRVKMQVCGGARGRSSVSFVEAKVGADGTVLASGVRVRRFTQTAHCTTVHLRWPFNLKFAGVGRYRLSASVIDSADRKGPTRTVTGSEVTD